MHKYTEDGVKEELKHVIIFSDYIGRYSDSSFKNLEGFVASEMEYFSDIDKYKKYIDFIKRTAIQDDRDRTIIIQRKNIKRAYKQLTADINNMDKFYDKFSIGNLSSKNEMWQYALLGAIYKIDEYVSNHTSGELLIIVYDDCLRVYEVEDNMRIKTGTIEYVKLITLKNKEIFYYAATINMGSKSMVKYLEKEGTAK